jgi:nucleotidyltransferase/DNA polymerase involved in DNA repair
MKKPTAKRKISAKTSDSLESLPNIGKVTADKLRQVGIASKREFLKRDPYKVFDELREKIDPTLCRCALAGIVGAKKGVPWHKITKDSAREYEKKHPKHVWGKC